MRTRHQTSPMEWTGYSSVDAAPVARAVVPVLVTALAMTLAAQVRVPLPMTDVPMTLQSVAVLMAGLLLSPSIAIAGMVTYVVLGIAGLPVYAPGSAGFVGPTGGFIAGFVVASGAASLIRGRGRASAARLLLAGAAAILLLFLCGSLWRALFLGMSPWMVVQTSVAPFAPKAVVELLLTVAVCKVVAGGRRITN